MRLELTYRLHLECHLHMYVVGGGDAISPVKMGVAGIASRLRPLTGSTNEAEGTEKLQNKCSHLQSELEKVQYSAHHYSILSVSFDMRRVMCSLLQVRRQLATEREEFHVKECKMEASLNTAHKANQELEVSPSLLPSPHSFQVIYMYILL